MRTFVSKLMSSYLALTLMAGTVFSSAAQAGMVSTEIALSQEVSDNTKARLEVLLARSDIQQGLAKFGISAEEAKDRVNTLSDEEAVKVANALDKAVAAGDGTIGIIASVALISFVVLIFTDILGLTKVFPFTRSIRQ